jgi:hypothetical protein
MSKPINIEADDENADWIKRLPGYRDELEIHRMLAEKYAEKARGQGKGQGGKPQGDGGAGVCVCPKCGKEYPRKGDTPCSEMECPECEVALVGGQMERAETAATAASVEAQVKAEDEKVGRRVRRDKVGIISKIKKEFDDLSKAIQELLGWAKYEDEQEETKAAKYAVQPFHTGWAKADENAKWSFSAADGNALLKKGWNTYKQAHLVCDTSEGATPKAKSAYKYPVAKLVDGKMTYFLKAAQTVYAGLRGGARAAKLPPDVNKRVLGVVKQIYKAFGRDTEQMEMKKRGEGQGQGGERQGDAGTDTCVCPECGKEYPHERGTPCNEMECEDCGVALTGKEGETETKAGRFVTIEGKPVFVGGAGQGGGGSGSGAGTDLSADVINQMSPHEIASVMNSNVTDLNSALRVAQAHGYWDAVPGGHFNPESVHTDQVSFAIKPDYTGFTPTERGRIEQAYAEGWSWGSPNWVDVFNYGKGMNFAFKTLSGDTWWVQFTTNAFRDREHEIFSTKALEAYVERHRNDEKKGEFWYRHIPGTKFGDVRWQAMAGRFLAQAGPFDDTPIGQAFKKFFSAHPDGHEDIAPQGWGTSHGYKYQAPDRRDGIYDWLEIKESTVLPLHIAANIWSPSPFMVRRDDKMNEQEKQELEAIGGNKLVDLVMQAQGVSTKLEEQQVDFKSVDPIVQITAVAEATEDEAVKALLLKAAESMTKGKDEDGGEGEAEKQADDDDLTREEIAEAMKVVTETLRGEMANALKQYMEEGQKATESRIVEALKPLVDDVKQLRKADDEKIAEKAEATPAASLADYVKSVIGAEETKVNAGDDLASASPQIAQPGADQNGLPSMLTMFMTGSDQKQ